MRCDVRMVHASSGEAATIRVNVLPTQQRGNERAMAGVMARQQFARDRGEEYSPAEHKVTGVTNVDQPSPILNNNFDRWPRNRARR